MIAASFGLLVIFADALLERRRAGLTVGVLLVAVFVTPAFISGETPPVWLFVSVAALWLVILRTRSTTGTSYSGGERTPALVLGATALAGAIAFPLVAPDISAVAASWGKPPPAVFGRGINPMLELGQNLRRNAPATALTYTTTLDRAPYLKVATLLDFTGKTWRPSEASGFTRFEGEVGIDPDIDVKKVTTSVTIRQLRSSMLPVPYPSLPEVSGLKGEWRWQRLGMTLQSRTNDSRGQKYSVTSLDIQPTANQLRQLDTNIGPSLQPYVALPGNMPAIIAKTAQRVTADADNDYDRALALQSYLRNEFTYSETAPVAKGYDGNGVSVIAKFLREKAGYCVHFSSAMAVMARTLDIPSRVAVGYAPGEIVGQAEGGLTRYESTTDDLHAWTELYFEGAGWTRFDPTPGIGTATLFNEPDAAPSIANPNNAPGAERQQTPEQPKTLDSVAPTAAPEASATAPRTAIVTIGGLLVLGAAPALIRVARRRWRIRRGASSPDPLWRELEDTARDHGVLTSATDTPRGFAGRLADRPGLDAEALDRLLHRVESARFSRDGTQEGDGVGDLRLIIATMPEDASRVDRVRAIALPRSLAGRVRHSSTSRPESPATLAT